MPVPLLKGFWDMIKKKNCQVRSFNCGDLGLTLLLPCKPLSQDN